MRESHPCGNPVHAGVIVSPSISDRLARLTARLPGLPGRGKTHGHPKALNGTGQRTGAPVESGANGANGHPHAGAPVPPGLRVEPAEQPHGQTSPPIPQQIPHPGAAPGAGPSPSFAPSFAEAAAMAERAMPGQAQSEAQSEVQGEGYAQQHAPPAPAESAQAEFPQAWDPTVPPQTVDANTVIASQPIPQTDDGLASQATIPQPTQTQPQFEVPPQPVPRQSAPPQAPPQSQPQPQPQAAEQLARPSAGALTVAGNEWLAAHGLEKSFGRRRIVKGVSLGVRRGEVVGLLGPNGAGKTTTFYMITGLIPADGGAIEIDGYDITHLPMYRRARLGIGYLPQEPSIFRGMTVEQNIMAVLELVEPDRNRRRRRLDQLLDEFSVTHLRNSPSIALSGGERRRVEIARALASNPVFMLLDEPFAGIDPIAVNDIRALVRHLTSRGIGVLITDHNVRETLSLIDRAYIIHDGQVLMEGTPDAVVANEQVRRYYLGEDFQL
jgi:lipopolysaccharide export system ATP-binding protein